MKKNLFIILFLFCMSMFYSCTSDIVDEINSSISKDVNISLVNSLEEIDAFNNLNIVFDSTDMVVSSILPRAHLYEGYNRGYSSFKQGSVEKTMFTPEVAKILGVEPYVLYLFRRVWVTSILHIQGDADFRVTDRPSPECGLNPGGHNYEIGYTSAIEGRKFVMTTILYYIQTYVSGQTVNKWAPRPITDLVWNYVCYFP